jgi:radical SAM/Cys-rich protein
MPVQKAYIDSETAQITPFSEQLKESGMFPITARSVDIFQINVGRQCNLSCKHCHVEAGPHRREVMSRTVLERCLDVARNPAITVIDITGGAPEMNPELPWFITEAAKLGKRLIVRSNLVILLEAGYESFFDLYSRNNVEIIGSLPDPHASKTDRQRGEGIFAKEITVIRRLNSRGYGEEGSGLVLDLVHNPVGAYLPGSQKALELEYKRILLAEHGVRFNQLFCLTNNPSGRYLDYLIRSGNYDDYMLSLVGAYNQAAAGKVMCRSTLSVGWNGNLYDCDFNQALGLTINHGASAHIDLIDLRRLSTREIVVADHCYACTAGPGSSCQGTVDV